RRDATDNRELVRDVLRMDHLEQIVESQHRTDDQLPPRIEEPVDRLQTVPCPRLDALAEGVVDADGDVDVFWFVLGHAFFERLLVGGDDGEVLGRDTVALGRVAVPPEGDTGLALFRGRQHQTPADMFGHGFLEDAAIDDLHRVTAIHSRYPPLTAPARAAAAALAAAA